MKLYEGGAYLVNGNQIVADTGEAEAAVKSMTGQAVTKAEAAKNTIAYGILQAHNTSGNMEKLKIKFDKLTSHDITFVGIIQTARASGLEKFPIRLLLCLCKPLRLRREQPQLQVRVQLLTLCSVSSWFEFLQNLFF